jgi:hypothetical protein
VQGSFLGPDPRPGRQLRPVPYLRFRCGGQHPEMSTLSKMDVVGEMEVGLQWPLFSGGSKGGACPCRGLAVKRRSHPP